MKRSERFARVYHSTERVVWMASKPCIVCGASPCEVSHTRTGGMGRKADYIYTVPKCRPHHLEYHRIGHKSFEAKYGVNLDVLAAMYQEAWQKAQARFAPIETMSPTE